MEAYTSNLGLLTDLLICPHNALVSHLKLVPGFRAYFYTVWKLTKNLMKKKYLFFV